MDILDIFSWLPEKELGLEVIKRLALKLKDEKVNENGFSLALELPSDANENITDVTDELISEGKKVCYLLRQGIIIAVIGYK